MRFFFGKQGQARVEQPVAWFQLLVSATEIPVKLLFSVDFQLSVWINMLTSFGCFGCSRAARPVLELFEIQVLSQERHV